MEENKYILVTGGAGYIGSHMVQILLENGYKPVIFDNLSTGNINSVPKEAKFIKGDLKNKNEIEDAFKNFDFDAVMHFAASLIVPESVEKPLEYYKNNILSAINLAETMVKNKVGKFIFSSTTAVYGEPKNIPIIETEETNPINPYGSSKLMVEKIIKDVSLTHDFSYIILRYFNVAGIHPSGRLSPNKNSTHLIPNVIKVANGQKEELLVFGNDYPTKDGTCIRDYIHVVDLCNAHLLALKALSKGIKNEIFNLGTSSGFSVKEVIDTAEKTLKKTIKYRVVPRRPGDPAKLIANSSKAREILGWLPKSSLSDILKY